ncbi:MAG: hypothetical protein QOJ38_176 [Solirubrobacterales bacterium]|jgi:uncharacterized membrane-anchored protein|nr:hypothetical protein [Solirubrobacterales bacterium]
MTTTLQRDKAPTTPRDNGSARSLGRQMLNKVPEVTLYFWVIKVLCTTVGETAADYLNDTLGFGLTNTTYVMGALLIATLVAQFGSRRYKPGIYWLAVVLISVVGTLITDNLTDNLGVALETTTIVFSIVLAATFGAWFASERTLSIHTIFTTRREAWYWLTVLFTFCLGTAAGDLAAERLSLGFLNSVFIFGGLIAIITVAHLRFRMNAILAFWLAYILTRPLGASIGDYLSQPKADGGLGLGTTVTSAIFLSAILGLVVYLAVTRRDVIPVDTETLTPGADQQAHVLVVANKTAATAALIEAVRRRAAAGPAKFFLLVPNPDDHLVFDRNSRDVHIGEQVLALALPLLQRAAGGEVEGRVAASPNAYDDIVAELESGSYEEVILSTLPSHVSHWLHVDLPDRIADLGYPVTTVTPEPDREPVAA